MFLQRFYALLKTRNREFLRDRSSVGWNILMPVLIIAGFALVFSGDFADQYKVGIVQPTEELDENQFFVLNCLVDIKSKGNAMGARSGAEYLEGLASTKREIWLGGEKVEDDSFLIMFNAHTEAVTFTVPEDLEAFRWQVVLDTSREMTCADLVGSEDAWPVEGWSVVLLQQINGDLSP